MLITFPFRVLAIDPATGKSGWTILDIYSLLPLRIVIVKHGQLDGDKLLKEKKEMLPIYGRQFCILDALFDAYVEIMTFYKPDVVVSESAFGYKHMNALISLTLAIDTLSRAARKVLGKSVTLVPPTITKKAFTGNGGADKDLMRLAYQSNTFLEGVVADDQITEHEIDAIGHGVGYIRRDLIGDVVQLSAKDKKAAKQLRVLKALEKQKEKESKG
jgi:Holliday junction resolvasome RuvABC endonuclease subunit